MLTTWTGMENGVTNVLRCSPIIRYVLLTYTFLSLLMSAPALAFG